MLTGLTGQPARSFSGIYREEHQAVQPEIWLYFVSNFSTLDLVDRERLTSRLMTLVRKNDEVHQRGKEGLELVVLAPAEAGVEEGFPPADDARRSEGGLRRRRRE